MEKKGLDFWSNGLITSKVIISIEEQFNIVINDDEIEYIITFEDLINKIKQKLDEKV